MALLRVNRESPCPVCGKHDWCLVAADKCLAICARVQSALPKGEAGWLHKLTDNWERSARRPVQRPATKPTIDWLDLCNQYRRACRLGSLAWLANELGVGMDSLERLQVGWNDQQRAFSFPMRDANGRPCGIRYRRYSGAIFSETHSREGLFFQPTDLLPDYLVIVEGASDAAATMDLGFASVIGRANNVGNVQQLLSILRGHRFNRVVVVPDGDEPGKRGAAALAESMVAAELPKPEILQLPDGFKDCRAMVQRKKNARWLQSTLARLTNYNPKQLAMHEANEHD
jgi:hypothetical protein